jgi:hypothetical protein
MNSGANPAVKILDRPSFGVSCLGTWEGSLCDCPNHAADSSSKLILGELVAFNKDAANVV